MNAAESFDKQERFVFDQIYSGALRAGASRKSAEDSALAGVADYNRNNLNPKGLKKKACTVVDLIQQRIEMAKKNA